MSQALLECADIQKSFGGVPVLKGITLDLQPGTVTALAGENGAGKSTLMKIVSGQYSADHGTVSVQGNHLAPGNTRDAVKHGVAIVPQELASIEDMTVYENLFVGRELRIGPFLNRHAMIGMAASSRIPRIDFPSIERPPGIARTHPTPLRQGQPLMRSLLTLYLVIGIAGLLLPGPVGSPFFIAGGVQRTVSF